MFRSGSLRVAAVRNRTVTVGAAKAMIDPETECAMDSFYWFDLETFGRDPRRTRIAQFAGLRTDGGLNEIDEPLVLHCRPADDLLPSPEASLITGITPQFALREGVNEAELFARIHEQLSRPGTCALGYNSLRFDDEFIRFGLYRNFFEPYEREWKAGNSRWDLLDLMRLAYVLRPEGMAWPTREDGAPSFRLEHLTAANGIDHGRAHDALADVRALLALARKLKAAQPRLWDYYYGLRQKRKADALVDLAGQMPLLHVSGKYPAARGGAALVLPLARHPRIDSRVIVFDLDSDPGDLLRLPAQDIADHLYTPTVDLPEGEKRVALKEVHLNRSPALVRLEHVRHNEIARLGIDVESCLAHAEILRRADGLAEKVRRVFDTPPPAPADDVDAALYDGFLPDADKRRLALVRGTPPEQLAEAGFGFSDPRFDALLFRYRARNWPETLDAEARECWDGYRRQRLCEDRGWSEYTFETYFAEIAALRRSRVDEGFAQTVLDALEAWGRDLFRQLEAD
jgi:exodeoxyribonuclease-1